MSRISRIPLWWLVHVGVPPYLEWVQPDRGLAYQIRRVGCQIGDGVQDKGNGVPDKDDGEPDRRKGTRKRDGVPVRWHGVPDRDPFPTTIWPLLLSDPSPTPIWLHPLPPSGPCSCLATPRFPPPPNLAGTQYLPAMFISNVWFNLTSHAPHENNIFHLVWKNSQNSLEATPFSINMVTLYKSSNMKQYIYIRSRRSLPINEYGRCPFRIVLWR